MAHGWLYHSRLESDKEEEEEEEQMARSTHESCVARRRGMAVEG